VDAGTPEELGATPGACGGLTVSALTSVDVTAIAAASTKIETTELFMISSIDSQTGIIYKYMGFSFVIQFTQSKEILVGKKA
jgi:aconitase B